MGSWAIGPGSEVGVVARRVSSQVGSPPRACCVLWVGRSSRRYSREMRCGLLGKRLALRAGTTGPSSRPATPTLRGLASRIEGCREERERAGMPCGMDRGDTYYGFTYREKRSPTPTPRAWEPRRGSQIGPLPRSHRRQRTRADLPTTTGTGTGTGTGTLPDPVPLPLPVPVPGPVPVHIPPQIIDYQSGPTAGRPCTHTRGPRGPSPLVGVSYNTHTHRRIPNTA